MDQDRKDFGVIVLVKPVGFSPGTANHQGIYCFQVARVGHQVYFNFFSTQGFNRAVESQVILYISITHGTVARQISFKLVEDLVVGFTQYIGQHIQTAAMGHSEFEFFHTQFGSLIDNGVEGWNGGFAAFQ